MRKALFGLIRNASPMANAVKTHLRPAYRPDPSRPRPMGAASSPEAFGHNGSNCCLAWADPTRGVVFAYLTDRLSASFEGSPHQSEVSDTVLAACR